MWLKITNNWKFHHLDKNISTKIPTPPWTLSHGLTPLFACSRRASVSDKVGQARGNLRVTKVTTQTFGCWSKNSGFSPQIIHFNRVFHYKPSILGYHYFWKHPLFFFFWKERLAADRTSSEFFGLNHVVFWKVNNSVKCSFSFQMVFVVEGFFRKALETYMFSKNENIDLTTFPPRNQQLTPETGWLEDDPLVSFWNDSAQICRGVELLGFREGSILNWCPCVPGGLPWAQWDLMEAHLEICGGFFQTIWETQSSRNRGDFQSIPFPTTWMNSDSSMQMEKNYIQIFSVKWWRISWFSDTSHGSLEAVTKNHQTKNKQLQYLLGSG